MIYLCLTRILEFDYIVCWQVNKEKKKKKKNQI